MQLVGAKGNAKYTPEELKKVHERSIIQPLELAIMTEAPLVKELLAAGANPSTILAETYGAIHNDYSYNPWESPSKSILKLHLGLIIK